MMILVAITLMLILIVIPFYTIILHKRKRLPPGPWPLPIIGNLHRLGTLPHRSLAKLAKTYGSIMYMQLGLIPTIIVSSSQTAELFLKEHDLAFASRPSFQAAEFIWYGAKDIGFCPYGNYWRQARKMATLHLLSAAKVEAFEGVRTRVIDAAVERLKVAATAKEAVNLDEMVAEMVEDVTYQMVVGKDSRGVELKAAVQEGFVLAGLVNLADYLPFLAPLDLQGLVKRMKRVSKEIDEKFEIIINNHLKGKNNDKDHNKDIILGTMLSLMENPSDDFVIPLTKENVKSIMLDLFSGGIDTAAVTISWALSLLFKHPGVMNLLQEELNCKIGRKRMVKESDLPNLVYLDMVVKETFRLYPPLPLLAPHLSMQDVVVNSYMIPKGSRIFVNAWAIQRDHATWSENANDFHPERFINVDIDLQGRDFGLIPFGSGRRGCPGMQLGLVTVKIILAQLVHCFDWDLPHDMQPDELDMTESFGFTVPRAKNLFAIPSSCRLHA